MGEKKLNIVSVKNVQIGTGIPKVIIPLMAATTHELKIEIQEVKKENPDMVEWRADALIEGDKLETVIHVLSEIKEALGEIPLLFTFRSYKEGGQKETSSSYYMNLLTAVIESKYPDLVDIELFIGSSIVKRLVKKAKEQQIMVIMSNHDFQATPANEEIINRLVTMQEAGADILKIAVMPTCIMDVLRLLAVAETMKTTYAKQPFITIAMGQMGLLSRIAGEMVGSAATFGSGKQASAPGQIEAEELKYLLGRLHYHSKN